MYFQGVSTRKVTEVLFIDYSNKMIYIDLQKEDQDKLNVLIKHGKDGRPGQNGENGQQGG
jgi:hypothetical protein